MSLTSYRAAPPRVTDMPEHQFAAGKPPIAIDLPGKDRAANGQVETCPRPPSRLRGSLITDLGADVNNQFAAARE